MRAVSFLTAFLLLPGTLCAAGREDVSFRNHSSVSSPVREKQAFEKKMGIQITKVGISGEGYIIDFRFRVIDPDRASSLLNPDLKPRLVEEATGKVFVVPSAPKIGSLRQKTGKPKAGKIYFILFSNPGKYLRPGNKVTFVIGGDKLENIMVD